MARGYTPLNRNRRRRLAEHEVDQVRKALPDPVRIRAEEVVVLFFDRPDAALRADGYESDLLGLFEGETTDASCFEGFNLPPQISLFVENIWEYATHDARVFRDEVRRTYLHELGHFLGMDEDDLRLRDLD